MPENGLMKDGQSSLNLDEFRGYSRGTVMESFGTASSEEQVVKMVMAAREDGIRGRMRTSHKTDQNTIKNLWSKCWEYYNDLHWRDNFGLSHLGGIVNTLRGLTDTAVSFLIANKPKVDFSSRVRGLDVSDSATVASLVQELFDEYSEKTNLPEKLNDAALESCVMGTAFTMVGVNPHTGEPTVENVDARYMAIDPAATNLDDARWVVRYRFVPVDWARAAYPHIADRIKPCSMHNASSSALQYVVLSGKTYDTGSNAGNQSLGNDGYTVLTEMWLRDDVSIAPIDDDPERVAEEQIALKNGIVPAIYSTEPNPENPRYHFEQHATRADELYTELQTGALDSDTANAYNIELQATLEHLKMTTKHPLWDLPIQRKFKKIRKIDVLGHDALGRDEETRLEGYVLGNTFPFSVCSVKKDPMNFWGNGLVKSAIPIADKINHIVGLLQIALTRQVLTPLKVGNSLNNHKLGDVNSPTDMIVLNNPQELAATGFINPPQIPVFVMQFLYFLIDAQQKVTGVVDSMQGVNPSGVRGSSHLQSLWSSASNRFMPVVRSYEAYMKRLAFLIVAVMLQYSDDPRVKIIKQMCGETNSPDAGNLSNVDLQVTASVISDDQPTSHSKGATFLALMQSGLLERPWMLQPFADHLEREFPGLTSKLSMIEQVSGLEAQLAQLQSVIKEQLDYISKAETQVQYSQLELEREKGKKAYLMEELKKRNGEGNGDKTPPGGD